MRLSHKQHQPHKDATHHPLLRAIKKVAYCVFMNENDYVRQPLNYYYQILYLYWLLTFIQNLKNSPFFITVGQFILQTSIKNDFISSFF